MKMAMRLDKTQLPSVIKKTVPGAYQFNRDLYLMAGFKTFDAVLVGAAGGASGYANGLSSVYGAKDCGSSGGGGGGSLVLNGPLADLPSIVDYAVGAAGTKGGDSSNNNNPGNGTDGGNSTLASFGAYGGSGGLAARWFRSVDSRGYEQFYNRTSYGGRGGGNSANLGANGVGAQGGEFGDTNVGIIDQASFAGSAGTFVVQRNGLVVSGGRGGGGGVGINAAVTGDVIRAGYQGNVPGYGSNGSPSTASLGGCGGGADISPMSAVNLDRYGQTGTGCSPNGVVFIKFS